MQQKGHLDDANSTITEENITKMVHHFYDQIREHPNLGPIFNEHVRDWDVHLAIMVDFLSSILLKSGRFKGSPMGKHAAIDGLQADIFHQWFDLFRETCKQMPPELGQQAWQYDQRIGRSLWMGYQYAHHPDKTITELNYTPSTS